MIDHALEEEQNDEVCMDEDIDEDSESTMIQTDDAMAMKDEQSLLNQITYVLLYRYTIIIIFSVCIYFVDGMLVQMVYLLLTHSKTGNNRYDLF